MTQRVRPSRRAKVSDYTIAELSAMEPGTRLTIPMSDGRYLHVLRLDSDDPRDHWLIMQGQKIRSSVLFDLAHS